MSLESITETAPIIEKLNKLSNYLPNQKELVYRFGKVLAYELGQSKRLTPSGFYLSFARALEDSMDREGGDPTELLELGFLSSKLVDIAKAVCPEDFADGVREFDELDSE